MVYVALCGVDRHACPSKLVERSRASFSKDWHCKKIESRLSAGMSAEALAKEEACQAGRPGQAQAGLIANKITTKTSHGAACSS